jgi:hypothetical protein
MHMHGMKTQQVALVGLVILLLGGMAPVCAQIGRPPAEPGVTDTGFSFRWENSVAWAAIGNGGLGTSGLAYFGYTSGDPGTQQDDNFTVLDRARGFLYLADKKKELAVDSFGRWDTIPNVDIDQQSGYFKWNTDDKEDNFDVTFKSTLVRDVFRWEYRITNKSAYPRSVGFRFVQDIVFPGNMAVNDDWWWWGGWNDKNEYPYYFPQAKEVTATSEFLGSAIPTEWYARYPDNPGADMNYQPVWGVRQPLQTGVTRPSRLVFASYTDLIPYGWDKIMEALLPANVGKAWPLKTGTTLGTDSAVGLYYPIVGIPSNGTRIITGEMRLDWAKTATVGHYGLGVSAPTWVGFRPGDDPSTTGPTEVENGYFSPDTLEVKAWVTNSSLIGDPAVSVTVDTGDGIKLIPGQDRSYSFALAGLETKLAARTDTDAVSWRVKPTGTVSGLIPIRVTANFSLGGSTTSVVYINVPATPKRDMQPANHFIGFPFTFSNADARVALGLGTGVQLAFYDNSTGTYRYASSDGITVQAGRGYWLKLNNTTTLNLAGASPADQRLSYRVSMAKGWNALSNPYQFSIEMGRCHVIYGMDDYTYDEAIRRGFIRPEVWFWNASDNTYNPPINPVPSSSPSTELKPYQGFWLMASEPVQFIFEPDYFLPAMNPNQPGARAPRVRGTEDDWQVNLRVETPGNKDVVNTFGVRGGETDTASDGDIMKPPPGPGGISAYFPHPTWGRAAGNYAVDLQAPGGEKTWTFAVDCAKANTAVTLRWPDLTGTPATLPLVLTDTVTGQQVAMRTSYSYTFDSGNGGTRTFSIRAGGVVSHLAFTQVQVLANRGRGTAGVTVALSAPAQLTLSLRTPTGHLVRTLTPGRTISDATTLLWDGRDAQGRPSPRGIYLGELAAEGIDGQRIRQMVPLSLR